MLFEEVYVSGFSDEVACYGRGHIVFIGMAAVLLILNFLLRYVASRFQKFLPQPRLFSS